MRFAIQAGSVVAVGIATLLLLGSARAETIKVAIGNVAYAPVSVSARVGDTIEWTNSDIVAHTATARDKSWDLMIMPNKAAKLVVKKAASIDYYCRFHPNMVGRIDVKE